MCCSRRNRGLEEQDLRIADYVLQEGRALIVAISKWDVAEDPSSLFNGIKAALEDGLSQARGVPLLTVSGATGKGIDQLLGAAFEVRETWSKRVSTGQLNRWFEEAVERNPPPAPSGHRIKLRYINQVGSRPPTFVLFGTRVDHLPDSYLRYLVNGIRRSSARAVPIPAQRARVAQPLRQEGMSGGDAMGPDPKLVDARGMLCPWPALRLSRVARELGGKGRIRILADDPAAPRELASLCAERGWKLAPDPGDAVAFDVDLG